MRKLFSFKWVAAGLLIAAIGCDPSGVPQVSSSLEETTVKGTVRVRGRPVDNGSVVFNAANVRRKNVGLRQAPINKDGSYTIKTLVGENSIQVSCKELLTAKNRMLSEAEYSLLAGPGENTFDIDISPVSREGSGANPPRSKRSPKSAGG